MAKFPPSIAMHSYSGSADMANSYLKLPKIGKVIFFSFSHCINMSAEKTLDVIKVMMIRKFMILKSDLEHSSKPTFNRKRPKHATVY